MQYQKHAITITHFLKICHYVPYDVFMKKIDQNALSSTSHPISFLPHPQPPKCPPARSSPAAHLLPGRCTHLVAAAATAPPVPLPSGKRAHEHEVPAAIGARQVPERARLREILESCGLCRRHCGTGRPCRGVGEVGHGSAPQHAPRGGVVGVRGLLDRRVRTIHHFR